MEIKSGSQAQAISTIDTVVDTLATELAKVPKSDSNISWNATALAAIFTRVANTIVTASPTAGSLSDILSKAAGGNTFDKATDSLEALAEALAAIKVQTDKTVGYEFQSSAVGDWQTAPATIISAGAAATKYRIHGVWIDLTGLTGNITIKFYMKIDGTNEREIQDLRRTITAALGPAYWLINGTLAIPEILRITAESDDVADNGRALTRRLLGEVM